MGFGKFEMSISYNVILDDIVSACDPLEITVKGDFTPRGNVHTVIEAQHIRTTAKDI